MYAEQSGQWILEQFTVIVFLGGEDEASEECLSMSLWERQDLVTAPDCM